MFKTINGVQVIDWNQSTPKEKRFYQLRSDWHYSSVDGRKAIAEEISRHPEWGLRVTDNGIERGG
jgi:hypothetical protein